MEHKKRKMFAAVAVIMLCAVAIVGVGYAYTASTLNEGNNVTAKYVTLYQGGNGAYTFTDDNNAVTWNAVDVKGDDSDHGKTRYTIATPTPSAAGEEFHGSYTITQVGESFLVKAKATGGSSGNLTCTVSMTCAVPTDGTVIFVKVNNGTSDVVFKLAADNTLKSWNSTDYTGTTCTFTITETSAGSAVYNDATVSVWYGYASSPNNYIEVSHAAGTAPDGPSATPITSASLLFSAEPAA